MDLVGYAPTPSGLQPDASTKLALNPFYSNIHVVIEIVQYKLKSLFKIEIEG